MKSKKICIKALEIRMNNNTVRGRIKNQLIVGSPLLAQDKLDFVAKKLKPFLFHKENWQISVIRQNVPRMVDYLFL